jgi:hypothetical protein
MAGGRLVQGGHDWRQGRDRRDALPAVNEQRENDRGDAASTAGTITGPAPVSRQCGAACGSRGLAALIVWLGLVSEP